MKTPDMATTAAAGHETALATGVPVTASGTILGTGTTVVIQNVVVEYGDGGLYASLSFDMWESP